MSLDDSDEKSALLNEIRDEVRRWSGDTHRGLDRLDRGLDRMDGQFGPSSGAPAGIDSPSAASGA
jgi:hypothetical protein